MAWRNEAEVRKHSSGDDEHVNVCNQDEGSLQRKGCK